MSDPHAAAHSQPPLGPQARGPGRVGPSHQHDPGWESRSHDAAELSLRAAHPAPCPAQACTLLLAYPSPFRNFLGRSPRRPRLFPRGSDPPLAWHPLPPQGQPLSSPPPPVLVATARGGVFKHLLDHVPRQTLSGFPSGGRSSPATPTPRRTPSPRLPWPCVVARTSVCSVPCWAPPCLNPLRASGPPPEPTVTSSCPGLLTPHRPPPRSAQGSRLPWDRVCS